jgi:hypothetical protein
MTLNLRVNLSLLRPVLLACAGVLAAGPVWADQLAPMNPSAPKDMNVPLDQIAPTDQGASAPSAQPGGKYGGVTPGSNVSNPLPQSPQSPPHLIWTGFQPTATGSRVFFQTTGPVEFEVKEGHLSKGGHSTLTVLLRGCRIYMANNRRKLDTRAFATPVQSVSAKQRSKDVELLITLREPASSTPATEAGPNGTRFLVFDFPPGKPAAIEEKAPVGTDSAPRGATSGEGWSLSGDGESVKAEAKGKAKSKGKVRAAAAPDRAAAGASPPLEPTPSATPPAGAK